MSDDKIAEIRARHDAGPRGLLPIPALAEALDDLATALAEVERVRAEVERLREVLRDVLPYVDTCNSSHKEAQAKGYAALEGKL